MNIIFQVMLLIFCLFQPAFASPKFLTISDIHYGSDNTSKDGQDTGDEFLKITLNYLKLLSNNLDFILILGDLPTHSLFVTSRKEEFEKTVFLGLYDADQGAKPMFYITGNNDSLSGNYQPFEQGGKSPLNFATDWTGACVHCEGLMIDDTHMRSEGYYSSYVIPGNKDIILIALNTTQWAKTHILSPRYPNQERDATEQLVWLEEQLSKLHARQLLIAMHIPPGNSYLGNSLWQEKYIQNFINLLDRYSSSYNQISLLASHSHMDELRRIQLKDGKNVYVYFTPSISRNHHNNPGMKIFTLNQQLAIKNYVTHYTTDLNGWGEEQYQAAGASDAIFPGCVTNTLAQCLDQLNRVKVCNYLEQGLYYGVKSSRVPQNVCNTTYTVN